MQRLAGELKLADTVTWLGDVSRAALAAEYSRADVFCLPSVQEGFGIVLLEAMAAGKPIVASRAGGHPRSGAARDAGGAGQRRSAGGGNRRALRGSRTAAPNWRAGGAEWVEQFDAPRVAQPLPGSRRGRGYR